MGEDDLRLYRSLSQAPLQRSYLGGVFFAAESSLSVPLQVSSATGGFVEV